MKKIVSLNLLLCLVLVFGFAGLANAQRVVQIAPTAFGIINDTIEGDTLANGDRVDTNTIYELERGALAYYIFNGQISNAGYHLHIRAAEGEDERPKLVPGVLEGGVSQHLFDVRGDITLEGLYLTSQDNGNVIFSGNVIEVEAESLRVVVDDCHLHGERSAFIRLPSAHSRVFVTNSIMSYSILNGRGIDRRGNVLDSLLIQNSTIYNMVSRPVRDGGSGHTNWLKIDHVTYLNVGEEVSQLGETVDVTFTNNLIINPGFLGVIDEQVGDVDAYFNQLQPLTNPELADRTQVIKMRNNNLWMSPELVEVFATLELNPAVFTDTTWKVVERIFADEDAAPLIPDGSFFSEAIEFTNGPALDTLKKTVRDVWEVHDGDEEEATRFDNGPEGVDVFGDPLYGKTPFDLSFSDTTQSYTAGDGGLPVGDLNWFPDAKAMWETFATNTLSIPITSGPDDAEEVKTAVGGETLGAVSNSSSDLEVMFDNSPQYVGMVFRNVQLEKGQDLSNAYIQFTVDAVNEGVTDTDISIDIYGALIASADAIPETAFSISQQPQTTAQVTWSPPASVAAGDATERERTPDISSILEEIIAQDGWAPGNNIMIVCTGDAGQTEDQNREFESYDGEAEKAPVLNIMFEGPVTSVKNAEQQTPSDYTLSQNYPNPFNPSTKITYSVPKAVPVKLTIYNIVGQKVRTLINNQVQSGGSHTIEWDGRDDFAHMVASGVYLYSLKAGEFTKTNKMLLLK